MSLQNLHDQLSAWREAGDRLVFTNGCFDILHSGHVLYLEQAKALGDRLILGLNSDDSVRRLKGVSRPYNDYQSRATVLAALASIDAVIGFEEDTPEKLIHEVSPDILVKGGDYTIGNIVGAEFVQNNGGEVYSLKFVDGFSTTKLIQKIINDG